MKTLIHGGDDEGIKNNNLGLNDQIDYLENKGQLILDQNGKEIETKLNERFHTLRNAFRSFDNNKNSSISESEFIEGLVDLNVKLDEAQIRQVFRELDKDEKGYLNFEDFCGLVQKRKIKKSALMISELSDEVRSLAPSISVSTKSRSLSKYY